MGTALAHDDSAAPFDLAAYDYDLPGRLIAQEPLAQRDAARLLVYHRRSARLEHRRVRDLPEILHAGDLLVLNDTRVISARLRASSDTGGRIELLLLRPQEPGVWICLARPAKRLRPGREISLAGGTRGEVLAAGDGRVTISFADGIDVARLLEDHGEVPLPPYIHRLDGPDRRDRERYQTVYAAVPGAVAAPTAGLHFTPELLDSVRRRGVETATVTLHVGPATFAPIRERDIRRHRMEPEWAEIRADTAESIARARREGRRVIAVGTTTTRALESRADAVGRVRAGSGWAERFLVPGCDFAVVGGLMTNFHLPRSTLLALVSAFAGREAVLGIYREAVRREYRFYSYGDAMLIL